jgi:hypothetical protein
MRESGPLADKLNYSDYIYSMIRSAIYFLLIISSIASCRGSKNNKGNDSTVTVSGTIYIQKAYCGGARPSEEMVQGLRQPASNFTLYYKTNDLVTIEHVSTIDSVKTDSAGHYTLRLHKGQFCFFEKWKMDRLSIPKDDKFNHWDSVCYLQQYQTCDFSINIQSDTSQANIILQRHCPWNTPCNNYTGPLPPAANPGGGRQPGHQE